MAPPSSVVRGCEVTPSGGVSRAEKSKPIPGGQTVKLHVGRIWRNAEKIEPVAPHFATGPEVGSWATGSAPVILEIGEEGDAPLATRQLCRRPEAPISARSPSIRRPFFAWPDHAPFTEIKKKVFVKPISLAVLGLKKREL
ncbi:hypothetical protein NDU88_000944 [Pleurodeles waltl]|uniref:Uncharacterized protein n=1 Tax=Pleurodeles waltl TaxID=8319 RepID=A0AAV7V8C2_PLEWA|nr:hypothetical protein NDU88_000944 [Pleurodeles waltl]